MALLTASHTSRSSATIKSLCSSQDNEDEHAVADRDDKQGAKGNTMVGSAKNVERSVRADQPRSRSNDAGFRPVGREREREREKWKEIDR